MGRVKNVPTPRGDMLGDYIKKAHIPDPAPPTVQVKHAPNVAGKSSAGRSGAVKHAKSCLPIARVNQNRSSSALSDKPQPPVVDGTAGFGNAGPTTNLTLRSSKRIAANGQDNIEALSDATDFQPTKRQKLEETPRRTSRLRKSIVDNDSRVGKSAVVTAPPRSPRPARTQRKTVQAARQGKDKAAEQRQKEAIKLLQGPEIHEIVTNTSQTPPADSVSDAGGRDEGEIGRPNKHYNLVPPARGSYTPQPASQIGSFIDEDAGGVSHVQVETKAENSAAHPSPPSFENTAPPMYDQNFIYRIDPAIAPELRRRNKEESSGNDDHSATSGDSGYITAPTQNYPPLPKTPSQTSYHPMYVPTGAYTAPTEPGSTPSGPLPMYGWYQPTTPWTAPSVPDMATHTFIISTKGQKVKGRPYPRAPRQSNAAQRTRNVANTYPRKQPFKAQIMFEGYPPETEALRSDVTLWEICQDFPNHLTGETLKAFVQREWSANELCACLKDDARTVLNGRPGKDKTMVFQKRLERVKKDLIAQGEYDRLLNSLELRPDGRPTWVKRGNVRRR